MKQEGCGLQESLRFCRRGVVNKKKKPKSASQNRILLIPTDLANSSDDFNLPDKAVH